MHPFSLLEVLGSRELSSFEVLLPISHEPDPLQRFLWVLKWYLATIQQEQFHKKPFNPVIGETHEVWTQTPQYGRTEFVGEQVSHHPPISAIHIQNPQEKVSLDINVSFGVKFGGNYVNVVTEGAATINVESFKEEYEMPKRTPDMVIKNVIFGTRKIFWGGEVTISCAKTGYSANLIFKEHGSDNTVKGTIIHTSESYVEQEVFAIEGKAGGVIYLKNHEGKKVLIDIEGVQRPQVHYKPRSELDPLSSLNVWKDVNRAIVANDMDKADDIKKKIEAEQRERTAQRKKDGTNHQCKFFLQTETAWVFKKPEEKKIEQKNDKREELRQPGSRPRTPTNNLSKSPLKRSKSDNVPSGSDMDSSDSSGEDEVVFRPSSTLAEKEHIAATSQMPMSPSFHSPMNEERARVLKRDSGSTNSPRNDRKSTEYDPHSKEIRQRPRSMILPRREDSKVLDKEGKKEKKFGTLGAQDAALTKSPSATLMISHEAPIMTGWMKMRNSMKLWINRWFVLKPGKLIYYKDEKDMQRDRCVGILRLAGCEVKYRPTNKDGFSFKIHHLLHYPIYHKYGLKGETLRMAMLPVSWNYCILRVSSEHDRKSWMESIATQIEYANSVETSKNLVNEGSFDSPTDNSDDDLHGVHQPIVDDSGLDDVGFASPTPLHPRGSTDDSSFVNPKGFIEEFQMQQKNSAKSYQRKTMRLMDEWKKELDLKLVNLERRLVTEVKKAGAPAEVPKGRAIRLSLIQLFVVVFVCIMIGKYIVP
eukprot:TRINITY_DN6443_c0_g1_i3.p1 TRINITY_DN6443_c0_g1~~TRINITY_DN6443_c0_g1_i3.p1  ORF type:complete len:758 (+),score=220.97 TRINITY_DN6443_c0_g1_i3:191-2464(+)